MYFSYVRFRILTIYHEVCMIYHNTWSYALISFLHKSKRSPNSTVLANRVKPKFLKIFELTCLLPILLIDLTLTLAAWNLLENIGCSSLKWYEISFALKVYWSCVLAKALNQSSQHKKIFWNGSKEFVFWELSAGYVTSFPALWLVLDLSCVKQLQISK